MTTGDETEIGAGEFKAKCLKLLDSVAKDRLRLTITKRGKPVAQLIPVFSDYIDLYGCMKDTVSIQGDIVEGTGEDWDAEE